MGGTSAERQISLSTGRQIMAALDPEKYVPMALDAAAFSGRKLELPPGVPVSALKSSAVEEGGAGDGQGYDEHVLPCPGNSGAGGYRADAAVSTVRRETGPANRIELRVSGRGEAERAGEHDRVLDRPRGG